VAQKGFNCLEKWFGLEDHAFTTTERAVVHCAMAVLCEDAKILNVDLDKTSLSSTANDAVVKRASEKFGENGDEIKAHAEPV
jgi:hypothetical protein